MIFLTKGIVLKTVKYGDTSVITSVFTELFGIQSYLINGIRTSGKGSSANAFLQPSSLLEMNVYHNELKNLQRLKDFRWSFLYQNVLTDVVKNTVAMYMIELLQKCLKQPESNPELFQFCEDAFIHLDEAGNAATANFPLYFSVHLAHFFGFMLRDNYNETHTILDLQEGAFTGVPPPHGNFLDGTHSFGVSQVLKARHPNDLDHIRLNKLIRKEILLFFQFYYGYHIADFGVMRTLPIVQTILS